MRARGSIYAFIPIERKVRAFDRTTGGTADLPFFFAGDLPMTSVLSEFQIETSVQNERMFTRFFLSRSQELY